MRLMLWFVDLGNGIVEDARGFMARLRDFAKIEYLDLMVMWLDRDLIRSPLTSQAIGLGLEDEPEYVCLRVTDYGFVRLDGATEMDSWRWLKALRFLEPSQLFSTV
jgi:hypothetical protein